jgi:hypothetical protein
MLGRIPQGAAGDRQADQERGGADQGTRHRSKSGNLMQIKPGAINYVIFQKEGDIYISAVFSRKETNIMTFKNLIASVATAALVAGAMLSTPTMARGDNGFSALQGVEAQALSSQEMQAITGELNALDIAADLTALAGRVSNTRLKDGILKLAAYYTTNADAINAVFKRLGIFTCPRGTTC